MSRERALWLVLVIIVVLVGGLLTRQYSLSRFTDACTPSTVVPGGLEQGRRAGEAFRPSLWRDRGLDLAVQAGLIFVAALGIAALLPSHAEDGEE